MRRLAISLVLILLGSRIFAQTACRLCRLDGIQTEEITSVNPDMRDSLLLGGPAVENSYMGLRIFFDDSGIIDLYSKSGRGLELEKYAWKPNPSDAEEAGAGGDFFDETGTLGIGGIALWDGEKIIPLAAAGGRTARAVTSPKGSYVELVSKGVSCAGDTLDVSVRIDVSTRKRDAWVTVRTLNGVKARFVTGVAYSGRQTVKTSKGIISVWGVNSEDFYGRVVPVGTGLVYSPGVFGIPEKTDKMVRIISKPSTQVSFRLVAASSLEAELNSARRFETYIGL